MKKNVLGFGKSSLISFLAIFFLVNCTSKPKTQQPAASDEKAEIIIYSVNYPLQFFAQRMVGNWADVHITAPPHADPAYWMPNQQAVLNIQQGDLLLTNGADYAKWLDKVSIASSKVVNTSVGFEDQYLKVSHAVTHSHGPEGEHSHEGIDFNTWLDPQLATQHAQAIEKAFQKKYPEKADSIQQNAKTLYQSLNKLDQSFEELTASNPSIPLVASHPVYGYFARRYQLNMESLHWEPDVAPSDSDWHELQHLLE